MRDNTKYWHLFLEMIYVFYINPPNATLVRDQQRFVVAQCLHTMYEQGRWKA